LGAPNQSIHFGRASAVNSLRPFPMIACKLIELIGGNSADFREVSRVLLSDDAFSSQVLRVANSPLLGSRREITSILQALSIVGVDRLRDLVVTVALKSYIGPGDDAFLQRCWRHDLSTALWCEMLAEFCHVDGELGYTAGILHDIGRIALMMLFPNDYAALLDRRPAGDREALEEERNLCDADHCQIGYHLSTSWNFPPVLGDVIAHHHNQVTQETPRLRLLVQAACTAASLSGFHTAGPDRKWEPARIERLLPKGNAGSRPQCDDLLEKVAFRLNETECSLLSYSASGS
jgi:putative nucleotidyltransferase with HDIG domain